MAGFTEQFVRQMTDSMTQNAESNARVADILNQMNTNMENLNETMNRLANGQGFGSQSQARDTRDANRNNNRGPFGEHHANWNSGGRNNRTTRSFLDAFEKSLLDSLGGSQFKEGLKKSLNKLAEAMGTDIDGLQQEFGDSLGKTLAQNIKNSNIGKRLDLEGRLSSLKDKIFSEGNINGFSDMLKGMKEGNKDMSFVYDSVSKSLGNISPRLGQFAGGIGNALKGIDKFTGGIGGALLVIAVAKKVISTAVEGVKQIIGGFSDLGKVLKDSANRYAASRQKNQELANKRLEDDVRTMIEAPFEILKKAADEVYSAWNANTRLIAGTQGYTKEGLQDLMSAYAQRLRQEGLDRTIASTEVYNNLAKVIQAGLTGNAAVEFAYQASKYNAAMPNQDFFNYVESYASVAANAIAAGKSENEALQIATNSLDAFANSLLDATRNLTGGYSTGLKAADSIYASAVKIAQAAKSDNIANISSSLLAIQGYVGSIAPDLANSLSDKIYQLATGGNSSDIVALRSLAGINASNTEFLRALAENPQQVLGNMFANLGNMFSQSPDAYMEKAEGYASLFGMSAEAFQRVDFMALAAAVNNMDSNTSALDENMKLLKEGQTTTNADQLKIAQINKYMVEEGLAYVIDNEAAQMIQQHMWDEQMARELMEAEYGVNLIGGAAQALNKILSGVEKVLSILNPISWLSKIAKTVETVAEGVQLQADIKTLLETGKVGQGNASDLYKLTARNQDLNLVEPLIEQLGGQSRYGNWQTGVAGGILKTITALGNPITSLTDFVGSAIKGKWGAGMAKSTAAPMITPTSQYGWGSLSTTSKAAASLSAAMLSVTDTSERVSHQIVQNAEQVASSSAAVAKDKLERMLSDEYLVEGFVKKGKSYQEWLASGTQLGISDAEAALTDAGYKLESVEEYFSSKQTEAGMAEKAKQQSQEQQFRDAGLRFWETRFWDEYKTPLTGQVNTIIGRIDLLISQQSIWRETQLEKLQNLIDSQVAIITNQVDWSTMFRDEWTPEHIDAPWYNWSTMFRDEWMNTAWTERFLGESGMFTELLDKFTKAFVDNVYYEGERKLDYTAISSVQRAENAEKSDAVYALADALITNVDDLQNPQRQTNTLLAQILVVVSAIMNQNNGVAGTVSLSDALTSLALGLTNKTPIDETPVKS